MMNDSVSNQEKICAKDVEKQKCYAWSKLDEESLYVVIKTWFTYIRILTRNRWI